MRRSGLSIMGALIGLVGPLLHFMVFAVVLGVAGYLCAGFIPVLGVWALLEGAGFTAPLGMGAAFVAVILCALLRGILRYGEQRSNHYVAFKLLALLRDKVFAALRRLCPAKLEGRDRGDLISLITGDIELLEVFYAHTISPIAIAVIVSLLMTAFVGAIHPLLGAIALAGYLVVGLVIPLVAGGLGRRDGMAVREGWAAGMEWRCGTASAD